MRLAVNPLEILASVAGGALAALLIVLVVGRFSPGSPPVGATLVNCAAVRARSRQDSASPVSAEDRRAARQCDETTASGGAATLVARPVATPQPTAPSAPKARPTRTPRTHGWRKAATAGAN